MNTDTLELETPPRSYAGLPDPIDGVAARVADDAVDVTGEALERWSPLPGLVFLVPGIALGILVSLRPWQGVTSGPAILQMIAYALGWITVGLLSVPHLRPPAFVTGGRPAYRPTPLEHVAWLVPLAYVVLPLFAPLDAWPHEAALLAAVTASGSWIWVARTHVRDRQAHAHLAELLAAEPDDEPIRLWASSHRIETEGARVATLPDDGNRLAAGGVAFGGGPDAAPERYARLILRHHHLRIRAGLVAACVHTAAVLVAAIVLL